MIEKLVDESKLKSNPVLPGKAAFELYDTFGFPVDLTQLILKENGMTLDVKGFETEMAGQKERSREDASVEAGDWVTVKNTEGTIFTGYDKTDDIVEITRYRVVKVKGKESYQLMFDKTPFYAESGGQAGDSGIISTGKEKIKILDTIKENNIIIHIASGLPVDTSCKWNAAVDTEKRNMTANNHSATHLLHFALRTVLGNHVEQKGSLVNAERLRFDFSHFSKLTKEEILKIELLTNNMVRENHHRSVTENISPDEAKKMGAMALFGEKYGEKVRVIRFGDSLELCGGTHVEATGSIGMVKIISEGAIAAGIRRIEAVTASKAEEYINEKLDSLDEISSMLKSTGNITENVEKMLAENINLKKTIEKYQLQSAVSVRKSLEENATNMSGFRFISGKIEADSVEILKNIAHQIRNSGIDTVMVIGSESEGKANLLVMVSDNLVTTLKINAAAIIKEISPLINGGGGGQPFLATAGGKNPQGIDAALEKAADILRSR
jgi:alanyl-tRNA synthetase